jgi:hypothetical protein
MNKLKFKSNSQILKLNNKIYIPFLIHNLPNYFEKINPINILKINTTIYINKTEIKNYKKIISLLNSSNINF